MTLGISAQVVGSHVNNASLINIPRGDVTSRNQVAQPLRRERVYFVVIGRHLCTYRCQSFGDALDDGDMPDP